MAASCYLPCVSGLLHDPEDFLKLELRLGIKRYLLQSLLQGMAFLAFAFNLVDQGGVLGRPLDTHRVHQIPSQVTVPVARLKVIFLSDECGTQSDAARLDTHVLRRTASGIAPSKFLCTAGTSQSAGGDAVCTSTCPQDD